MAIQGTEVHDTGPRCGAHPSRMVAFPGDTCAWCKQNGVGYRANVWLWFWFLALTAVGLAIGIGIAVLTR